MRLRPVAAGAVLLLLRRGRWEVLMWLLVLVMSLEPGLDLWAAIPLHRKTRSWVLVQSRKRNRNAQRRTWERQRLVHEDHDSDEQIARPRSYHIYTPEERAW